MQRVAGSERALWRATAGVCHELPVAWKLAALDVELPQVAP